MVIIIFCNFACSQECVAHSRTFTGQTCWLWLGQETPTWVDRGRTQTSWYQRICFPWGKSWYFPLCRNMHGANFFSLLFVHFGVVFLEKAIRGFQKFCTEADDRQSQNICKIRKNISNRNVFWKSLLKSLSNLNQICYWIHKYYFANPKQVYKPKICHKIQKNILQIRKK